MRKSNFLTIFQHMSNVKNRKETTNLKSMMKQESTIMPKAGPSNEDQEKAKPEID